MLHSFSCEQLQSKLIYYKSTVLLLIKIRHVYYLKIEKIALNIPNVMLFFFLLLQINMCLL